MRAGPRGQTPADGLRAGPCYRGPVEAALIDPRSDAPAGEPSGEAASLHARWLGRVAYDEAHAMQKRLVDERVAGAIGDQLLLLEHPPVLTLGRNSDPAHILASDEELAARGITVVRTERGGEVTYHGPGQLVAYPIIRLHERGLLVRPLVRALESALVATCAASGVIAGRRDGHPGCWCDPDGPEPRKIGALGLRVERGVSYHGIALNITVDLADFELIDPCGMPGVPSTSIARERGDSSRTTHDDVGRARRPDLRPGLRSRDRRATADGGLGRVASGLFELRKDPITGWWVATIVDRAFHRDRFARAAEQVDDQMFGCANCSSPAGDGVRTRMLKDFAFHVIGTDVEARELDRDHGLAQVSLAQARATGSWRTVIAPPGEHRPLHAVGTELIEALVTGGRDALAESRATGQTEYLTIVQNWGAQAGARTNHLCLDLYDLPQIPHRIAEELGGAARFVIREGECPFCRLVRDESRRPDRLVWEDADSVAFAPYASRSSFEIWIVPRRHDADFGRATSKDIRATAEALRNVLGRLATTLDGPPYNLVLHTAPLREQVDGTYHWHWEIHPRLREIAGLELGTGLPVNPVSPEDAVEELLGRSGPEGGGSG